MEKKCDYCGHYGEPIEVGVKGDKKHLWLVCQRCGNRVGTVAKKKKWKREK